MKRYLLILIIFSSLIIIPGYAETPLIIQNEKIIIDTLVQDGPLTILNSTVTITEQFTVNGATLIINSHILLTNPETAIFIINAYNNQVQIINSTITYNGTGESYYKITRGFVTITDSKTVNIGTRYKSNTIYRPQTFTVNGWIIDTPHGTTMIKDNYNSQMNNITIRNIDTRANNILLFRGSRNSVLEGLYYSVPRMEVSAFTVVAIEATQGLTIRNIEALGYLNVHSPHFHILCTGVDKYPALGVIIENGYFYGGGNGACTGWDITYNNCTFERITDGTEVFHLGSTKIIDSTFIQCTDSAINLQNGAVFDFLRCKFEENRYPVNIANGVANLVNSTFSGGAIMYNFGNNKDTPDPSGILNQSWEFKDTLVTFQSTYQSNRDLTLLFEDHIKIYTPEDYQ